jgi:hypothetical protein
MNRDVRQAEQSAHWAKFDLLEARAMQKSNKPGARQQGREDSRVAKRRRRRSNRRLGKLICREHE